MAPVNRKTIRQELAAVIDANKSVIQIVYDHRPASIEQSPAICLASAGTGRPPSTQSAYGNVFFIVAQIWVLIDSAATTENELDDAEHELATIIQDNFRHESAAWIRLMYAERTRVLPEKIILDGRSHYVEPVLLQIDADDS